ncbi:carbohydrate ABC transporter permease [Paenibacillus sp. strain BS8-2]
MKSSIADRMADSLIYVLLLAFLVITLVPFLHIVAMSLSSNGPILSGHVTIFPVEFSIDAYKVVLNDSQVIQSLFFTIQLTVMYTVFSLIMTICCAYPLTKTYLRGYKVIMLMIVVTMFFGGGVIPEYILMKELNLLNTMWVMIIPGLISPFYMIIMRSFFKNIPEGIEESAQIDGSTHFGILTRIVLPLSMPVIATLSLFYAVHRWNGFMDSLLYITDTDLYPMQLRLYNIIMNASGAFTEQEGMIGVQILPESLKSANIVFATVPILLAYPWLQKYFVSGMTLGSVKG